MNEIIAKIDGGDLVFLALAALVTFAFVVHRVCAAFEPADEVDDDELAERIETAIKDATADLLGVLEEIRDSNQAILDDEDADAVRYQPAAEHIGSSLHRMVEQYGRPRGFRPAETAPPYEFVDLTKHDADYR